MAKALEHKPVDEKKRTAAAPPLFGRWASGSLLVLGLLIFAGLVFLWRTNDPSLQSFHRGGSGSQQKTLVDETPWNTAKSLTALAVTEEELAYARDAERLADHLVDQAFATALR